MNIRILLADDHRIVGQGLRCLIEGEPGMEVVAEAEDGRRAVKLAKQLEPDIVIMDIAMPGLNGIEATRQILSKMKQVKVIGLSMHADRALVAAMLKAGASGYMLKDSAFEKLTVAINAVRRGRIYLDAKVADFVAKDMPQKKSSVFSILSPREREVLQLLSEGGSTRDIAERLGISIKTVETYRRQIMEKLNIRSIAELTKYAVREGLTSLDK